MLLGWGCTAGPRGGKAQQPGTPLSDQEYHQFFRSLRTAHRASTACLLRALYGCQNPLVQRLDEYENHGVIPEGKANRDSQGQADGWGSCMASTGPDRWEGTETHEWWRRGVGSEPAVRRRHLLVSILSHTRLHPNVSLGPASSHALGHGDDQEAVEFLTKVQGGIQMARGFSWRDVIQQ